MRCDVCGAWIHDSWREDFDQPEVTCLSCQQWGMRQQLAIESFLWAAMRLLDIDARHRKAIITGVTA
jgi:hypothetical protein